jgi:uncharacterized protein (DUF849 family)
MTTSAVAQKMAKASRQPGHKRRRVRHGPKVGTDIDGVGDQQQQHQAIGHPGWIVAHQIAGDAVACHPANAGADHLHRRHQGVGQDHRPAEAVAILRAGLAVGGDAAGIVVGRASDQAGADNPLPVEPALAARHIVMVRIYRMLAGRRHGRINLRR